MTARATRTVKVATTGAILAALVLAGAGVASGAAPDTRAACKVSKVSGGLHWDTSDPTQLVVKPFASIRNCGGKVARLVASGTVFSASDGGIRSEKQWEWNLGPSQTKGRTTHTWTNLLYTDLDQFLSRPGYLFDGAGFKPPILSCTKTAAGTDMDPAEQGTFFLRVFAYDRNGRELSKAMLAQPVLCGVNARAK